MNKKPTEKEWRKYCKDCYKPEFHKVIGEYANLPEYLRRYCELWVNKK